MIDEVLKNLKNVTEQFQSTVEINEKMKEEAISKLSESDKDRVRSIEGVAKRFADQGDINGLMNYMSSIQEKMKKDASND